MIDIGAEMKEAEVLFLGGVFPKEKEKEIGENSIGAMQNAANVLQWHFIEGLDQNCTKPVKIINAPFVGSYPKRYKKMFVKSFNFSHTDGADDYSIGFCNLMGIKRFFIRKNLRKAVKNWVRTTPGQKVIFGYAMTGSRMAMMQYAKKLDKNVTTVMIVPDLPQYMHLSKTSKLFRLIKNFDAKSLTKKIKYVDMFVLLTKQMAEYLNINNYVVVEGIAKENNDGQKVLNKQKTIVYAGGLNIKYGAGDLIDAFEKIKGTNYKLILCGSGDAVEKIRETASRDSRIDFRGLVPHDEVLQIINSATVLVNPRKNNEEYTKYSFPSKTMEYMATGVPVVAYKLDGIPDEYDDYLNYVKDDSNQALADKLMEICELSEEERKALGQKSKTFILQNKNSKIQVKKVIDSLEKITS